MRARPAPGRSRRCRTAAARSPAASLRPPSPHAPCADWCSHAILPHIVTKEWRVHSFLGPYIKSCGADRRCDRTVLPHLATIWIYCIQLCPFPFTQRPTPVACVCVRARINTSARAPSATRMALSAEACSQKSFDRSLTESLSESLAGSQKCLDRSLTESLSESLAGSQPLFDRVTIRVTARNQKSLDRSLTKSLSESQPAVKSVLTAR